MSTPGRARHIERKTRTRQTGKATGGQAGKRFKDSPNAATRKSSDERWNEILLVSARMFAEHGFAATALQHIADELDMLKGSLYYYINTKEDLLYEVIRSVYWEGMANFKQMSTGPGPAMDRLTAAIKGHVRHLIANITATTVYLHEFNQLSEARQEELSSLDYSGWIRDLIKEGQADGSIRADLKPSLVAMAILGATNWVYRWYRQGRNSPEEIADEFATIFTSGLATAPE